MGNDTEKSEGDGEEKCGNGKKNGNYKEQPNITIVCQQVASSLGQNTLLKYTTTNSFKARVLG